jgi:hypothetical protein
LRGRAGVGVFAQRANESSVQLRYGAYVGLTVSVSAVRTVFGHRARRVMLPRLSGHGVSGFSVDLSPVVSVLGEGEVPEAGLVALPVVEHFDELEQEREDHPPLAADSCRTSGEGTRLRALGDVR